MRKLIFGAYGGLPITVNPTPWSALEDCRTGKAPCKYNVRDQARAISCGAVDIDPVKSRFVYLPQVTNWPNNFCSYAAINAAVKAAIERQAPGLSPDKFNHLMIILPKHCALGQGQQPGTQRARRRTRARGLRSPCPRAAHAHCPSRCPLSIPSLPLSSLIRT